MNSGLQAAMLEEHARINALAPGERLEAFILLWTYSHDMPYIPDPEAKDACREFPDEEFPAVVARTVRAYRDEVLREAAEKIRNHKGALNGAEWHDFAADLIDPDKEPS